MSKLKRYMQETMGDDWVEQLADTARRTCEEDS